MRQAHEHETCPTQREAYLYIPSNGSIQAVRLNITNMAKFLKVDQIPKEKYCRDCYNSLTVLCNDSKTVK